MMLRILVFSMFIICFSGCSSINSSVIDEDEEDVGKKDSETHAILISPHVDNEYLSADIENVYNYCLNR